MQTQKTFIKKTRRGNIIKVVREHYLRDDILLWQHGETDLEKENCNLHSKLESRSRWEKMFDILL